MLRRKIKAYLSGPIRGRAGKAATPEIEQMNIKKGIDWKRELWMYFGSQLETYCPHAQDLFPQTAMEKGYLTVDQVLDIDCKIVAQQDVVIVMNWENHVSGGMCREISTARLRGIPYRIITGVEEADLRALQIWLEEKFNE